MVKFIDVKVFRNKSTGQVILTPSTKELKRKNVSSLLDAEKGSVVRIRLG